MVAVARVDSNEPGIEDILASIAVNDHLNEILGAIVSRAAHFQGRNIGALTLLTPGRDELEIINVLGTEAPIGGKRLPVRSSLNGLAITSASTIKVPDFLNDPRPTVHGLAARARVRSVLIVPLRGAEGPFGTLIAATREIREWTTRDESFLAALAHCASIAIQQSQVRGMLGALTLPTAKRAGDSKSDNSRRHPRPTPNDIASQFTPRERQIIDCLMTGTSCKEIASSLGISSRTVEHHIERLKLQFKVSTLHGLVARLAQAQM